MSIDELVGRMQTALAPLESAGDPRRFFLATYLRTTLAVRDELDAGGFRDGDWVEEWDVVFAGLYLDALENANRSGPVPRPWAVAFATVGQPPLRHVLLGMNAHVNFDLPQAILAVISSEEFDDPQRMSVRQADHRHLDAVLAGRVAAEDEELVRIGGATRTDRVLRPLNRLGTQRFLREAREKVWVNAVRLDRCRREGPAALSRGLSELESVSAARVQRLCAPGPVLLKLAVGGFGVRLAGQATSRA